METPLSPLDFARRTRRLHADREAVVDGDPPADLPAVLRSLRPLVRGAAGARRGAGDRVATISPNTHAQLESFYSVPQLGAVLVPINYRLTAEDFVYIVNHSAPPCSAWPRSTWRRWTASATGCLG
jgi:Acyl-CoA synthetases (AMP-forming)/AMP-acid ligases II